MTISKKLKYKQCTSYIPDCSASKSTSETPPTWGVNEKVSLLVKFMTRKNYEKLYYKNMKN